MHSVAAKLQVYLGSPPAVSDTDQTGPKIAFSARLELRAQIWEATVKARVANVRVDESSRRNAPPLLWLGSSYAKSMNSQESDRLPRC